MNQRTVRYFYIPLPLCVGFAALSLSLSSEAACRAETPGGEAKFQQAVAPVLEKFCRDCHGTGAEEGGFSFAAYPRYADLLADKEVWAKAEQLVSSHVMPPAGEPKPSLDERATILRWIDEQVFYVDPARPDPGPITLRRLNRVEYNNSLRDVLGIESRPADQFPPDDSGYGFDNIGDVLSLSSLHLEKYLAAARDVAAEAVRIQRPPRLGVELTADKLDVFRGKPQREELSILLDSPQAEVGTRVHVPVASTYKVFVKARAAQREAASARLEVVCDQAKLGEIALDARQRGEQRRYVLVELSPGEHRIALRVPDAPEAGDIQLGFLGAAGPFAPTPRESSAYLQTQFGDRPLAPPLLKLSGEDLEAGEGRSSLDTGKAWFASNGYRRVPVFLPDVGNYRLRFLVGAQQVGDERVRFEIRLGKKTLGPFTVTVDAGRDEWVEFEAELPAGEHDLQVWFVNEYTHPKTGAERWLWVHEFTIEGPTASARPLREDDVEAALVNTARRLFRRPADEQQVARIHGLVQTAAEAQQSPLETLRLGLEALLVSPKFLFHPRPTPAGDRQGNTELIDEYTLASRLSYFLWSSAPDEELLALAEKDQLRERFTRQVQRMLRDPKSRALTENFAGQWLQLRDLEHAAPDPAAFPEFDAALLADMRRESEMLFEHVLHQNRPVTELLDADYTFVNARLAGHYGLSAKPKGDDFQKVSLEGTPRGGILTHGSILTLTSHPTRTSPVNRGKWLLEQLLGTPPPPPPANVTPLEDAREDESLPLRKRLEQHRANPQCASCHAFLDPMGFALENYDAVGRWREEDEGRTIDTRGALITGEQFADFVELRRLLVEKRQDQFLKCLSEHLLTYALGRGITYRDKPAVREIMRETAAAENRFQAMILAVCRSVPFQRMRVESE